MFTNSHMRYSLYMDGLYGHTQDGRGIPYRDYVTDPTGVLIEDPRAFGLPEILTTAYMGFTQTKRVISTKGPVLEIVIQEPVSTPLKENLHASQV